MYVSKGCGLNGKQCRPLEGSVQVLGLRCFRPVFSENLGSAGYDNKKMYGSLHNYVKLQTIENKAVMARTRGF